MRKASAAPRAHMSPFTRNAAIFLITFAAAIVLLEFADVRRVGNVVNVAIVNAAPRSDDRSDDSRDSIEFPTPSASGEEDDIWTITEALENEADPEAEDDDALASVLENLTAQVARDGSQLPRTMPDVPYNEMRAGERYFMYSPGGGWNNQLICFYAGVFLAKKFNRTLIVPPAGRHANTDSGYYALTRDETIPMDHLMDLEYMSRALRVRLLPLNMTLKEFHEGTLGGGTRSNAKATYIKWKGIMLYATPGIRKKFLSDIESAAAAPVVFAKGHFFNQHFAQKWYWEHMRYAPFLAKLSKLIVDEVMGNDFDAFHMRLGDYKWLAHKYAGSAKGMLRAARAQGMSPQRPLYLATDSSLKRSDGSYTPWYAPFEAFKGSLVTQTKLLRNERVRNALADFKARLPPSKIYMTVFGVVEQMVCARARTFMGTHMSTFTITIVRLREHIATTMPDMLEDKDDLVWEVGGTYKAQWNGRTTWKDTTCNLTTAEPDVVCDRSGLKISPLPLN